MFNLIVGVICGIICVAIASHKGRNTVGWFFAGFFIGIIGIIIIACLSNLTHEQARQQHMAMEQHRLREQLRQERMKHEAFRQYSMARLDAHDDAIGLDTRAPIPLLGQNQTMGQLPGGNDPAAALHQMHQGTPQQQAAQHVTSNGSWYYELNGETNGPVSDYDIRMKLRSGMLSGSALVWTQGMPDWQKASAISNFRDSVTS